MKNKAIDIHNIMVDQLERLMDIDIEAEDFKSDTLTNEIRRAGAVGKILKEMTNFNRLQLDAIKAANELPGKIEMPAMFKSQSAEALPLPGKKK